MFSYTQIIKLQYKFFLFVKCKLIFYIVSQLKDSWWKFFGEYIGLVLRICPAFRYAYRILGVCFIIGIFPTLLYSQNTKVSLIVKDSLMQYVDAASCSVFNVDQNILHVSTWSDERGKIIFDLPSGDSYVMKVSYMGMISKELKFDIAKNLDSLDLGTLVLNISAVQLSEVVVRQKRIVRKGNVITVNVKGSSLENIGTGIDVLKEIPRVSVQGNNISVLGKGLPSIFLNGHKISNIDEIQYKNARRAIVVTLLGSVTEVSLSQFVKADSPIVVKLFPITKDVSTLQSSKADRSIVVTLSEITTEVRLSQL